MTWTGAGPNVIDPASGELVDIGSFKNNWVVLEASGITCKICSRFGLELNTNPKRAAREMRAAFCDQIQKYRHVGAKLIIVIESVSTWPMKIDEQQRRRIPIEEAESKASELESEAEELRLADKPDEAEEKQKEADKQWKKAWFVPRDFLAWQVVFCENNNIKVVVAPYEADSQCFAIARQLHDIGEVGIHVVPTSNDGDFIVWALVSGLTDVAVCYNVGKEKGKMQLVKPHKSVLGENLKNAQGRTFEFENWTVDNFVEQTTEAHGLMMCRLRHPRHPCHQNSVVLLDTSEPRSAAAAAPPPLQPATAAPPPPLQLAAAAPPPPPPPAAAAAAAAAAAIVVAAAAAASMYC
jgi:hypothetical protein